MPLKDANGVTNAAKAVQTPVRAHLCENLEFIMHVVTYNTVGSEKLLCAKRYYKGIIGY